MLKREKLDNIYDTLLTIQNNERAKNADLQKIIEHKKMEISRLEEENNDLRTQLDLLKLQMDFIQTDYKHLLDKFGEENDKLHEYLNKTAEILKERGEKNE